MFRFRLYLLLTMVVFSSFLLICCSTATKYDFSGFPIDLKLQNARKPWSINIEKNIIRAGKSSLRFELRPGDLYRDGFKKAERTELSESKYQMPMDKGIWYVGFSILIPEESRTTDSHPVFIGQWHDYSKWGRYPNLSQKLSGNNLYLNLIWSVKPGSDTIAMNNYFYQDPNEPNVGSTGFKVEGFRLGQWFDFIYNIKWAGDDSGFLKLWVNGKKIIEYSGPTAYHDEEIGPYFKFGIYAPFGLADKRIMYFDEYRRGENYETVDPAQNDIVENTNQ